MSNKGYDNNRRNSTDSGFNYKRFTEGRAMKIMLLIFAFGIFLVPIISLIVAIIEST